MADFWESKIVKTRKIHRCAFCNTIIPKNSFCEHNKGLWQNEFQNYYLCTLCNYVIYKLKPDLEDGFDCYELHNEFDYKLDISLHELDYYKNYIVFEENEIVKEMKICEFTREYLNK
jgi:hypothetical protein